MNGQQIRCFCSWCDVLLMFSRPFHEVGFCCININSLFNRVEIADRFQVALVLVGWATFGLSSVVVPGSWPIKAMRVAQCHTKLCGRSSNHVFALVYFCLRFLLQCRQRHSRYSWASFDAVSGRILQSSLFAPLKTFLHVLSAKREKQRVNHSFHFFMWFLEKRCIGPNLTFYKKDSMKISKWQFLHSPFYSFFQTRFPANQKQFWTFCVK